MNTRGWTTSREDLDQIRFLDWLWTKRREDNPRASEFSGSPKAEGGIDDDSLESIVRHCEREGTIRIHLEPDGFLPNQVLDSRVSLTGTGWSRAVQREARWRDRSQQNFACRDALIAWTYSFHLRDEIPPSVTMFVSDARGHFEGRRFDPSLVDAAMRYLKDRGLISWDVSSGWNDPRPRLTPQGVDCAEQYDYAVLDYLRAQHGGGSHFHTHFNAPVSGQVGIGANVAQTQHPGLDGDTLERLLNDVRRAAEEIDPADAAYLLAYVDTLRAEAAADQPDPALIKGSSARLRQIAAKVGNTALSASVSALTATLLTGLGLG